MSCQVGKTCIFFDYKRKNRFFAKIFDYGRKIKRCTVTPGQTVVCAPIHASSSIVIDALRYGIVGWV